MPFTKYRSIEEMPDTIWREPGTPEHYEAMSSIQAFSAAAFPRSFPPGLYKHRTLASAEALRRQWEDADFRRLWASRGGLPTQTPRNVADKDGGT